MTAERQALSGRRAGWLRRSRPPARRPTGATGWRHGRPRPDGGNGGDGGCATPTEGWGSLGGGSSSPTAMRQLDNALAEGQARWRRARTPGGRSAATSCPGSSIAAWFACGSARSGGRTRRQWCWPLRRWRRCWPLRLLVGRVTTNSLCSGRAHDGGCCRNFC
jgi:hypothetical protein